MVAYVARRLAGAAAVVYLVVTISFFMVRLMPGNAVSALEASLRSQGGMTPQEIQQQVSEIYGGMPHSPVGRQYLSYIGNVARGDLGRSVLNPSESVAHIILGALPWTIFLVGTALMISFVLGTALGAAMAMFRTSRLCQLVSFIASVASAVPNYLVAIVLLYELADMHRFFPVSGAYSVNVRPGWSLAFIGSVLYHGVLPISAYVVTSFGGWALAMKGSSVSCLEAEYVRVAKAWGLSDWRVTRSYVGRNSMLPMVTMLALSLGFMVGGSVFVETYFSYPGIGYYLIQAVNSRDYSVMMGCFMLITVAVVLANLFVDLFYPLVDPRIARPRGGRASVPGALPVPGKGAQGPGSLVGVEA
ncbi:MAG: ABC transporter permease [Actinobacteria bacterium]|nr:ABC transporter permease [Actinomycetota bacterium]